jgi:hypothetical protein
MSLQAVDCSTSPDLPLPPAIDLALCLSHIEAGARTLDAKLARVCVLEAQVQELTEQRAKLIQQLEEAAHHSVALETALVIEQTHSARAEALAQAAASRARDLQASAFGATEKLETLGGAITAAFDGMPEAPSEMQVAA